MFAGRYPCFTFQFEDTIVYIYIYIYMYIYIYTGNLTFRAGVSLIFLPSEY